jgi:hypothetical protein
MKSKGKKFLSALLVSSMVLTSSLGFMPRMAQASNTTVYSYDFEYVNTVTETGNKKIVLNFEKNLTSIDSTKFSILGDTTASIGLVDPDAANEKVSIVIDGIDPSVLDYTLQIEPGGLVFSDYQQIEPLTVAFKSYDITPGFKSIFKDAQEANKLLDANGTENIILHVDSDYVTDIAAKNVADADLTEISVTATDAVSSVMIEIQGVAGDNTRNVSSKSADDTYKGTFSGVTGIHTINVTAYDANGKQLDYQSALNDFGTAHGTNFDTASVKTFDPAGYKVSDIVAGSVDIADVVAGKSYAELDDIKVQYDVADDIFRVSSASDLANALSDIAGLSGKPATIYLESDITLSAEVKLTNNDDRLTVKGNGHTISGNVQVGNENNQVVKLSNVTITGDVDIDVGAGGDAYLTDVSIGGNLVVTSGDYSSVYLTRVTTGNMVVQNDDPVHIIAYTGTAIGNTALNGSQKVKLTMAGGSFGSDIVDNMTHANGKLVLEGDKTKGYDFEKVTVADTATSPSIQLLQNTKILNLVVGTDVTMDGHSSSEVVKSSDSTAKITYDGFRIADATSDTAKYVGTNVPADSGAVSPTLNIPTSNNNTVKLGGTILNGYDANEVNDGGETLTLTLSGNLNWAAVTPANVATMLTDTASELDDAANFAVTKLSDKVIKVTWNNSVAIAAGTKATVTFDPAAITNAFVTPDASIIGTSVWAEADPDTAFNTLYRPTIQGTDDFVVYAYHDLDAIRLGVTQDLSAVIVHNVANTYEYRTNLTEWTTFGGDDDDVNASFTGGAALGDDEVRELQIRAKDGDGTVKTFEIKKNEPWFRAGAGDAANIRAALVHASVNKIYFSDEQAAYDFSGEAALTQAEATIIENKAYSADGLEFVAVGTPASSTITTVVGVNGNRIDADGVTITADTTKPAIANTSTLADNTTDGTIENDDTIVFDFSENMSQMELGDASVNVTVTNAAASVITIYKGATSTDANDVIATITATGKQYNSGAETMTFNSSNAVWTDGDTLTITLKNLNGGTAAAGVTDGTFTVDAGTVLEDLAGNTTNTATVTGASSSF